MTTDPEPTPPPLPEPALALFTGLQVTVEATVTHADGSTDADEEPS